MSSALARFRPRRTDEAFVLLGDAARDVAEALDTLERVVHAHPASSDLVPVVRELDLAVHRTTHELVGRLNERFIVPAEPDALRRLADGIAAIAGGASHIAGRLAIFRLPAPREHARRLAHLFVEAAAALRAGVSGVTRPELPNDEAQRLRDLAHDGELLVEEGLADLFGDAPEPAILVGWSDLYERFRSMLVGLDTIADALDAIKRPSHR